MHYNDTDIAHIEVDIAAIVEGIGSGACRCSGGGGQRKDLVVAVLIEGLCIREKEVASVNVLLDVLE